MVLYPGGVLGGCHPRGGFRETGFCEWGCHEGTPPSGQQAGGKHPTGVLSCYLCQSFALTNCGDESNVANK